jgi:hypothetical protein
MPKPSADLTDEQLHQRLVSGEYEGRDALRVLSLQILQPLHLVRLEAAILLTPAVIGDLGDADRPGSPRPQASPAPSARQPAAAWR